MLQNVHHQFKELRERLVAEYLKPTFNAAEVVRINLRLEELLSQITPPKPQDDSRHMPTAGQVEGAVAVAAKLLDVNPTQVLLCRRADTAAGKFQAMARARTYVAMALRETFPNAKRTALARLCGFDGETITMYYANLDMRIRSGKLTWFDQSILDQVIAGIAQSEEQRFCKP